MKRFLSWSALYAVSVFAVVVGAWPMPAAATEPVSVVSECHTGWYVNHDEANLLPTQTEAGFLLDGPSLVHHAAVPPVTLDAVTEASFTATVSEGVAPLFKMETSSPYSTVNVLPSGLAWTSKLPAAEEGGQNKPVSLATLADLWKYNDATRVATFGVGYANDSGNKAVVTSITFNESTFQLKCEPEKSPTPTPTPTKTTASPTPTATATPTGTKSPTAKPTTGSPTPSATASETAAAPTTGSAPTLAAGALPVTGDRSPMLVITLGGLALLAIGSAMLLWVRRRSLR